MWLLAADTAAGSLALTFTYLVRGRGPAVAGKAQAAGRENMKAEPRLAPAPFVFLTPGPKAVRKTKKTSEKQKAF